MLLWFDLADIISPLQHHIQRFTIIFFITVKLGHRESGWSFQTDRNIRHLTQDQLKLFTRSFVVFHAVIGVGKELVELCLFVGIQLIFVSGQAVQHFQCFTRIWCRRLTAIFRLWRLQQITCFRQTFRKVLAYTRQTTRLKLLVLGFYLRFNNIKLNQCLVRSNRGCNECYNTRRYRQHTCQQRLIKSCWNDRFKRFHIHTSLTSPTRTRICYGHPELRSALHQQPSDDIWIFPQRESMHDWIPRSVYHLSWCNR